MNLLITGGAGFIGSNFVRLRRQTHPGDRLVVLDALTYAGNLASLDLDGIQFVRGDICDGDLVTKLLADHAIEAVVHFAAESHVDRSIDSPEPFIQTNVVATLRLLHAVTQYW